MYIIFQIGINKYNNVIIQSLTVISVLGNSEKDALSLMNRLAMFTGGDTEQLLRIFKSSGQFNENKPMSFYERLAERATNFIKELKAPSEKSPKFNIGSKRHFGLNSKT